MIGAYIFTRMLEVILNKQTEGAVAIFAGITMLVVAVCILGLINIDLASLSKIPGQ
jgi:hypothetical protein